MFISIKINENEAKNVKKQKFLLLVKAFKINNKVGFKNSNTFMSLI